MSLIKHSSHKRLISASVWSLMGTVVPMLAALLVVPWLMHALGHERFGVLSLVWVVVGYFSFLDMGLGRAVTVAVAVASLRADGSRASTDEFHVLGSAAVLLMGVGLAMALVLGLCLLVWGAPFKLSSPAMGEEVRWALWWSLPSLPLLLLSSAFRGHLEGVGAFKALNLLRIPTGILLILGPCLSAAWSPNLVWACLSILLVRAVHLWVLCVLLAREMACNIGPLWVRLVQQSTWPWLRRLLSFGGWVTSCLVWS